MNIHERYKKLSNTENVILRDDEVLLKMNNSQHCGGGRAITDQVIGYMTKLNKNGTIPQAFSEWAGPTADVYIMTNIALTGWKVYEYPRHGGSQTWIRLIHPYGFIIETQVDTFIDLIQTVSIIDSVIQAKCIFDPKTRYIKEVHNEFDHTKFKDDPEHILK